MRMLALLAALWASTAVAQDTPGAAAQAAAERLQIAATLLDVADTKRDRVAALTETVKAYEAGLIAMRDGLRRAAIRQRTIEADLADKSGEVGQLLGVLQAMGRAPTPLLLLHPNGPVGTARGGMIAAELTPALQTQVDELRLQLEEIALLQRIQGEAADTLEEGLLGAQEARARLSEAISNRTALPQRFADDPVQTALLLASTNTLEEFAAGLTDTFLTGDPSLDPVAADGTLPLPVLGQVIRGFNAPDAAGISRPGVIIAGRPGALVTTPTAATLLFRGPLLDYGNVVILEPAQGILFVLGGLGEVYGEAGQVLPAGSPVGLMGGDLPDADAILNQSDSTRGGAQSQTLYLEVRDGQSPVDPAAWFALDDG